MKAINISADDLPAETPDEYRAFIQEYTAGTDVKEGRPIVLYSRNIVEVIRWMLMDEKLLNYVHFSSESCKNNDAEEVTREMYESKWWKCQENVNSSA